MKLPVEYAMDAWIASAADRSELNIVHQFKVAVRQAILDEREACALAAENVGFETHSSCSKDAIYEIVGAIRARGVASTAQEISQKAQDQGA